MDNRFYRGLNGGRGALVSRRRWLDAKHGGVPAGVLVVYKLCHLHGDGKPHQLADGLRENDFLRHLLLPRVFAALFRDAWRWPPAALYAGQFVGLGLYAGPCADGALAHLHGEGGAHRGFYADGDSWRFGARDRRDDWRDGLWRNANHAHHGGDCLDSRFCSACGREEVIAGQWGRTLRVLWGMGFDRSNLNFLFMWLVNLIFFYLLL